MPSVLEKVKSTYLVWHEYHTILPKTQRYSLGNKIDKLFVEVVELIVLATFLPRQEKYPYLRQTIRKFDTLKILIMILWETKSLDNKRYINLSVPMNEIGKMLGGWMKQNSPTQAEEK